MKFELMNLEEKDIAYHLPKPGGRNSNGKWAFNNLYVYNDIMFRRSGSSKWLDYYDSEIQGS